jgi:phage shock protein PspC (stress-responsive transcriptional regulator)
VDETPQRPDQRRLARSRENRILGGVCAGLAEYLGVDVILIRIAFVVLAFAGGGGVILYVLGWILIPEDEPGAGGSAGRPAVASGESARLIVGTLLIAVGAILLVNLLVPGVVRYFWPLALIGVGVAVIAQSFGWWR